MKEQQQRFFNIEKIYVKDLSLEISNAPLVFLDSEAPKIDLQMQINDKYINEGMYEVVLTATVTAKTKDKTIFLVEVLQAGIFQIRNIEEVEMATILNIACPNVIFPYMRETISDIVTRAGFPPVILSPVNFEALYNESKQQATTNGSGQVISGPKQ
ncbi:MAG: protein-export chaperone SecB [Betaproteobacteria bacterium]|nr:MAG: protein-export chaperone SecB [Betaproteobacteria bacterium]